MEAITRDMTISRVIQQHPEVETVFVRLHMSCLVCMGASEETIEAGARMHGIAVERLLDELNGAVQAANRRH